MSTYTQDGRPLQVLTPLVPDALLLEELTGTEGISEPFQFRLELLAERPVPCEDLLGQPVSVFMDIPGCPRRYIHGIISELSEGLPETGPLGQVTFHRYTAELVPEVWLLGQRVQSRTHCDMSVPDILKKVLASEWGLEVSFILWEGDYPKLPLCVQYQESDLHFVSRIMEVEGIRYFFQHDESTHTMVVSDHPSTHPKLTQADRVKYTVVRDDNQPPGCIESWSMSHRVHPLKVSLRDHHLQMAQRNLKAQRGLPAEVPVGRSSHPVSFKGLDRLEVFDPQGGYAHHYDGVSRQGAAQPQELEKAFPEGQRRARIRIEQEACRGLRITGAGKAAHLLPGHSFSLADLSNAEGEYLVTHLRHQASQKISREQCPLLYANQFETHPAAIPYRPVLQTANFPIYAPITATVIGYDDSSQEGEVVCDKHGRVKVRFHWNDEDESSTAWLRVSQAWAGNRYGMFHIPRVGNEVVVSFLNGDKDRPIITGCVHTDQNLPPFWGPPYTDNEEEVASRATGVRTMTVQGGVDDFSHIYVDDSKDDELVGIRSNRDVSIVAQDDLFTYVGNSRELYVGIGPHWFQPPFFLPPSNGEYSYGLKSKTVGGSESEFNFGSRSATVIDPSDYAINKIQPESTWSKFLIGYPLELMSMATGRTQMCYGNETFVSYGTLSRGFYRGQKFDSVLKFSGEDTAYNILFKTLTATHLSASMVALFLPIASGKAKQAGDSNDALVAAEKVAVITATVALALIKFTEKKYAYARAAEVKQSAVDYLRLGTDVYYRLSDIWENNLEQVAQAHETFALEFDDKQDGNYMQEVHGTYAIHSEEIQTVTGGDISTVALNAKVTTAGRTINHACEQFNVLAAKLDDADRVNRTRYVTIGTDGYIELIADDYIRLIGDEEVELYSQESVLLGVGDDCKIELSPNKIEFTCGGSKLTIDAAKIESLAQIIKQRGAAVHHKQ